MGIKLNLICLFSKLKKIFTIIILFKNKGNLININLDKSRYKKINTIKKLLNIKFENFKFPNVFLKE